MSFKQTKSQSVSSNTTILFNHVSFFAPTYKVGTFFVPFYVPFYIVALYKTMKINYLYTKLDTYQKSTSKVFFIGFYQGLKPFCM